MGEDARSFDLRAELRGAVLGALRDLDPEGLVRAALPPLPPKRARVRVVAAGKAAIAMARGAFATWGDRIDDALVVTNEGAAPALPRTRILGASHPLPDARSEAAAEEALARAGELGPTDLLLALISGGASSLLSLAPVGGTLEQKRLVVAALLASGASIRDVNVVRRHASRIKGGRLAIAAAPARTLTLCVSDVIGGEPHDIGSGPSVPDPTSVADAADVLRRYAPGLHLPLSASLAQQTEGMRTRARIVADPDALAARVAARLEQAGLRTRVEAPDELDAAATARARVALARSLGPMEAAVIACEPRITLPPERGRGGRAGHVALAASRDLPAGVVLLCAASDGRDGSSGSAGATVSCDDAHRLGEARLANALARFDDATAHLELGTTLDLGATGTNHADVHVLARGP